MAVGLPLKTTYLDGDVFSAADINDTNGTINAYSTPFAAGKNKLINADFRYNQRQFTSNTATGSYNFDRWLQTNSGGSFTVTPQTFTLGSAPVSGYEGKNYLQGITASQSAAGDYATITQRIEDVRNFAGQTVVVSFWAKANTGTPKIGVELCQNFGVTGSPSAQVNTALGAVTLSTSWARYSISVAVPSISGKTLGTTANSSYLELNLWISSGSTNASRASSIGIQNFTASIWGVQIENGTVATPFQTATGTLLGEYMLCQRYYCKSYNQDTAPATNTINGVMSYVVMINSSTTMGNNGVAFRFPVIMRTAPTITAYSYDGTTDALHLAKAASAATKYTTVTTGQIGEAGFGALYATISGGTIGQAAECFFHYVASSEL